MHTVVYKYMLGSLRLCKATLKQDITKEPIHHHINMAPQLAWIGLGNMGRVRNLKSYQMKFSWTWALRCLLFV